jgi:hypothetical protein
VRLAFVIPLTVFFGSPSLNAHAEGVDLLRQDLVVDVASPTNTTVTMDLEFAATGTTSGFSAANFAIPVTSVLVNGAVASATPNGSYPQYLTDIIFPSAFNTGDSIHVSIQLSGTPSCNQSAQACSRTETETLFTFSSPGAAWYFANPFETDPFLGSVTMRVPSGFFVNAAHGALNEKTIDPDGAERWSFDFVTPTETFGGYAASASSLSTAESQLGLPISATFHTGVESAEEVQRAADTASRVLPKLIEYYGALPVDRASLVTVPKIFPFGAMSTLGIVYVNEVVFTSESYLVEQGMAHETAHFWWGNLASAEDPREGPFFGESLAEYSGWRALGDLDGEEKRTTGMRMNATWYMYRRPNDVDMAVLTGDQESPAYVFSVYHKGPLVLRTIAEYVGEAAFANVLKQSVGLGLGGLSVDKLTEAVKAETGTDIAPLVDQWLRKKGFPRITLSTRVEESAVSIDFSVEGKYTLRLPVLVTFVDGESSEEIVDLQEGDTSTSIPISKEVASIEIDPAWTMVREVLPKSREDVTLDGDIDGADLIATALRAGTNLPTKRRVDGRYDPLFDVDDDREVGNEDLDQIVEAVKR